MTNSPPDIRKFLNTILGKDVDQGNLTQSSRQSPAIIASEVKGERGKQKRKERKKPRGAKERNIQLRSGYTSEDGDNEASEAEMGINAQHGITQCPTFKIELKIYHVAKPFWMPVPAKFAKEHFPSPDPVRRAETKEFIIIELKDSEGLKWEIKYLTRRKGFSAGWMRFVIEHDLFIGDTVEFELVTPRKFETYITRISDHDRLRLLVENHMKEVKKQKQKQPKKQKTRKTQQLGQEDRPSQTSFQRRRTSLSKGRARQWSSERSERESSSVERESSSKGSESSSEESESSSEW